jgi:hypothetical protein
MRKWIILACLALFGAYWAAPVIGWWTQPVATFLGRREFWWDAEDFAVFYAAGTIVARGDIGALYDAATHAEIQLSLLVAHEEALGFYNPPLFALVFVPLSWLPYEQAFQVWTGMNVVLLCALCALVWRIAVPLDRAYRVAIIVAFLTMYPLPYGLRLGQFSLILAASWALAYVLLCAGRPRAAGFALAPLLIKPELLIPVTLFLAWKRQWETLRALLPVSGVAILLSVVMIGPAGAWDYGAHILAAASDGTGNMYGWNGLLASIFAPDEPGSMTLIAAPLALLTLLAAASMWRGRLDATAPAFPAQWLALTLATVLWDAHFYLQDLVIVAPPAIAAFAAASGWRRSTACAALIAGWIILGLGSVPAAQWGINLFSAYMVLCLAAIVASDAGALRALRRAAPPSVASAAGVEARAA